jgi:hypothetical protein
MGTEEKQQSDSGEQQQSDSEEKQQSDSGEQQQSDSGEQERSESGQLTEKPEVTDEHKEKAKEMAKSYDEENLQTSTLPGSGGTVSGTAITDWVDDDDKGKIETSAEEGKVEYRKSEEFRKIQES